MNKIKILVNASTNNIEQDCKDNFIFIFKTISKFL